MEKKRIVWLDIARTFIIVQVVMSHAKEAYCLMTIDNYNNRSIFFTVYTLFIHLIGRTGLPFFFFLSGYLVLNKNFDDPEDIKKFWKSKWIPLLIAAMFWRGVDYIVSVVSFDDVFFDLKTLVLKILMLKEMTFLHSWYMPMILGVYLSLPFIAGLVKKIDFKIMLIPFSFVFFKIWILHDVNRLLEVIRPGSKFNFNLDLTFLGSMYGIYIILGYYIFRKELLKGFKTRTVLAAFLISQILSFGLMIFYYEHGLETLASYDWVTMFVTSISLFELIKRLDKFEFNDKVAHAFSYISSASLGVYFIHKPLQIFIQYHFDLPGTFGDVGASLFMFALTFTLCLILCKILSSFEITRKYLVYM